MVTTTSSTEVRTQSSNGISDGDGYVVWSLVLFGSAMEI